MRILLAAILIVTCAHIALAQTPAAKQSPPATSEQGSHDRSEEARQIFEAGNRALSRRQFDEAINLYDQVIAMSPRQPAVWSNKAATLIQRAAATYNSAIMIGVDEETRNARMKSFRDDLREAVKNATKAVGMVRSISEAEVEPRVRTLSDELRSALRVQAEAMYLFTVRVDITHASESLKAFSEYLATETDESIALMYQLKAAKMMLESRKPLPAYQEFQKVFALDPDNVEALLGSGVALLDLGFHTNDEAKTQEGLAYLQRFVDRADEQHPQKNSTELALKYLREEKKAPVKPKDSTPVYGVATNPVVDGEVADPKRAEAAGLLNGKAISKPAPVYPAIAKWARIMDTVVVQVVVDEKGEIMTATAVSGHPLLRAAAVSAAQQARFSPTMLNGQPVRVAGVITYNFTLQ